MWRGVVILKLRAIPARVGGTAVGAQTELLRARGLERFDEEEDFRGHRVVQIRGVGEGAVAAASDDDLESADENMGVTWKV